MSTTIHTTCDRCGAVVRDGDRTGPDAEVTYQVSEPSEHGYRLRFTTWDLCGGCGDDMLAVMVGFAPPSERDQS